MTKEIDNSADVLDSRDIIARIEELQNERDCLIEADEEAGIENPGAGFMNGEELATLEAVAKEGADYASDWEYGAALIRDSYFTEYAQELLEDCGDLPRDLPAYIAIDWDATARNIQADYTSIEFDGITYWIR
jgi:hypothetical protein